MIPKTIGRYEILQELGRGGMAIVYLARDPRTDREVAIKVLPREFLYNDQFRVRFEREIKTVAQMEHPAIVPIHDVGEDDGQPYFVMRNMTGGSLSEWLKHGAFSLQDTARIVERLCKALAYAHKKGIIHRDLKPGNILFDNNGEACISDFGVAKLVEAASTMTGSGVIGTPAYMSPEQAQSNQVDARSDIYAMGAIVYEMLTGVQPYKADTPMGVVLKHITDPVPEILRHHPDFDPEVSAVIKRAMSKNPDDRYPSMLDLAKALNKVAFGTEGHFTEIGATRPRLPAVPPSSIAPTVAPDVVPAGSNEVTYESPASASSVPAGADAPTLDSSRSAAKTPPPAAPISSPAANDNSNDMKKLLVIGGVFGVFVIIVLAVIAFLVFGNKKPAEAIPTSTAIASQTALPTWTAIVVTATPLPVKNTEVPQASPTVAVADTSTALPPVPEFEPSQWNGTFRWFGSVNPVTFIIEEVNGSSFIGAMYWTFTQCRVTERAVGDIYYDITTAPEQDRWALHPDYQSGDLSGVWLRWTQNESIGATRCYLTISGDWWYAHINSEGRMVGIHFTNSTNTEPDRDATFNFTRK